MRTWLRAADPWRATTVRGRGFAIVGALFVLLGLELRERQILRIGVLLLLLTVAAGALLGRTQRRLEVLVGLSTSRVQLGRPVVVRVSVDTTGRVPVGPVGVRVRPPVGMTGGGDVLLAPPRPGVAVTAELPLHPQLRGRYDVPPVLVEVRDALGLCRVERAVSQSVRLTVLPRTETLHGPLPVAGGVTRGAGGSRGSGIAGDMDSTVREYRSGDDRRRVHWRSSARLGELMVRGEEQQSQAAVTVLLDTRAGSHRLSGATGTFEWAVGATASITRHLLLAGHEVRLVGPPGRDPERTVRGAAARTLGELERLVDVRCDGDRRYRHRPVAGALPAPDRSALVAVLGAIEEFDLTALRAARAGRPDALALLLDVDSWELGDLTDMHAAQHRLAGLAAALRRSGWRSMIVERGMTAASAWTGLLRPGARGLPVAAAVGGRSAVTGRTAVTGRNAGGARR